MEAAPKMKPYLSDHDSGVVAYLFVRNGIVLKFKNKDELYLYNDDKPGINHVRAMKKLAIAGSGLSGYVSKNIKDNYAAKSKDLTKLLHQTALA